MQSLRKNILDNVQYYLDVVNHEPKSFGEKVLDTLGIHSKTGRVRANDVKDRCSSIAEDKLLLQAYSEILSSPASGPFVTSLHDVLVHAVFISLPNTVKNVGIKDVTLHDLNKALFQHLGLDKGYRKWTSTKEHDKHRLEMANHGGYAVYGARSYGEVKEDLTKAMIVRKLQGKSEPTECLKAYSLFQSNQSIRAFQQTLKSNDAEERPLLLRHYIGSKQL